MSLKSYTFYTSYKGWKLVSSFNVSYRVQSFYTSYKGWKPIYNFNYL